MLKLRKHVKRDGSHGLTHCGPPVYSNDQELVEEFLRRFQGVNQEDVARRVPGVTQHDVSRWRRGTWKRLSEEKRAAINDWFHVADGGLEIDIMEAVWDQLPDVSFLKPEAREEYDRLVGSYVTRGWPPEVVARAARSLTNVLSGANSMRMGGFKAPDLPAEEQLLAIRGMAPIVERIYGEIERASRGR